MSDLSCSDEKPIKILHLIDSGGLYGAEKVLLQICVEQQKQGLSTFILSCGLPNERPKEIELQAEELGISCKQWRMTSGLNFKGMRDLWQWIDRHGFTILHSHGYKFNILLGLTAGLGDRRSRISTLHGYTAVSSFSKLGVYKLLDLFALSRFHSIVWVGGKSQLDSNIRRFHGRRVRFIANGVPFSEDSRSYSRDYSKRGKLLMVGRLSEEKGHIFALQCLAQLRAEGHLVTLCIAGDGPLRDSLTSDVSFLGLQDCVSFLGFVDDPQPLYRSNDLLLIPSLTEGLPLTLLEAIGYGMPIIASNVGAIGEVLQDADSLIADLPNLSGLKSRMTQWLRADAGQLERKMELIRARVYEAHSSSAMSGSYLDVYGEVDA